MRVVVDRGAGAVRLELGSNAVSRRVAVAEGVTVLFDAAERVVGLDVGGVDPVALGEVTVALADGAHEASGAVSAPAPAPATSPLPPAPPAPHLGPLFWDPEAEAAMGAIPFFNRGRHRLAASALARRRGLDRVTVEIVEAVGR